MVQGIAKDAFGLPEPGQEDNDEFAFLNADTDQAPQPAEESQEAPVEVPATGGEAPEEPVAVAESPPEETQEEAAERLWANKYNNEEELEKGYFNLSDLQRRTSMRARQAEEQAAQVAARNRELEQMLNQAVPYIEEVMRARSQPQPVARPAPEGEWPGDEQPPVPQGPQYDPRQVESYVERTIQQRLAEEQARWEQERQAAEAVAAAEDAIYGFYDEHPEVQQDAALERDVTQTVIGLHRAWQQRGYAPGFDVGDQQMLDIAYEAVKNPELRQVLELNPQYTESEAGMKLARFEAGIARGDGPITERTERGPAPRVVGQRPPVTESAATGTTNSQGTDRPLNEFEEAILEYRKNKQGGLGGSVFS